MASFTDDPAQLLAAYQAENANNPFADPFLFQNNDGNGYWTNALPTNNKYLSDNAPGSIQITPGQVGFQDVEGNSMQAVNSAMSTAGMTDYDRAKLALGQHRFQSRQQLSLDSLSPEDQTAVIQYLNGRDGTANLNQSTNGIIFSALGPELSSQYGLSQQSVGQDNDDLLQAKEYGKDSDFHDNAALNKQALITMAAILAGGFFAPEAGAGAAGAGEAGASGAGYTGTASELAADGLGGVDMWGATAGEVGAGAAGSTAYYDSGAGMWVDSATGEGIASGTAVPEGYAAAEGSTALAAGDAAPAAANEPGLWDTVKEYYNKGNNAKNLASALSSFTSSPQVQGGGSGTGGDFFGSPEGTGTSGAVSATNNSQSQMLESPAMNYEQVQSAPVQQQAPQQLGLIDISPANNAFMAAGSTWNQQMANALRNRNAY